MFYYKFERKVFWKLWKCTTNPAVNDIKYSSLLYIYTTEHTAQDMSSWEQEFPLLIFLYILRCRLRWHSSWHSISLNINWINKYRSQLRTKLTKVHLLDTSVSLEQASSADNQTCQPVEETLSQPAYVFPPLWENLVQTRLHKNLHGPLQIITTVMHHVPVKYWVTNTLIYN